MWRKPSLMRGSRPSTLRRYFFEAARASPANNMKYRQIGYRNRRATDRPSVSATQTMKRIASVLLRSGLATHSGAAVSPAVSRVRNDRSRQDFGSADRALEFERAFRRALIFDLDCVPGPCRVQELRRLDVAGREAQAFRLLDAAQHLGQQQRARDDRVAGKVAGSSRMVRSDLQCQLVHFFAQRSINCTSASRVIFPVELRGSASTKYSGRGRNTASTLSRKAARIFSAAKPGATTKASGRVTAPSPSSGRKNTPSCTPAIIFR